MSAFLNLEPQTRHLPSAQPSYIHSVRTCGRFVRSQTLSNVLNEMHGLFPHFSFRRGPSLGTIRAGPGHGLTFFNNFHGFVQTFWLARPIASLPTALFLLFSARATWLPSAKATSGPRPKPEVVRGSVAKNRPRGANVCPAPAVPHPARSALLNLHPLSAFSESLIGRSHIEISFVLWNIPVLFGFLFQFVACITLAVLAGSWLSRFLVQFIVPRSSLPAPSLKILAS